jgi:D-psicose/D-tagatose/L-ribulose 3-epimerase
LKIAINLLVIGAEITLDHGLQLEKLKACGFDAVEVPMFTGTPERYAALGRMLADIGLDSGAAAIATAEANPISPESAVRAKARDLHRWLVDCTHAMGGEVIAGPVHSPVGFFTGFGPTTVERERCIVAMGDIADYAAAAGIRIAVEPINRFESYLMSTVDEAAEVVAAVDRPNFGILFDTFHANIEAKDPVGTFERHHVAVNHFHVSENDRGIPGTGHVPFAVYFDALRRNGYDDWLTIEAFSRALPEIAGATRVWRDLFDSTDELFREGPTFVRRGWEAAGERLAAEREAERA